jgi:uncharacterized protein YoxC
MNRVFAFLIGLSFIGLLGFTVIRDRAQTKAIDALNLRIADIEKSGLRMTSARDELISVQEGFARSMVDLRAKVSALDAAKDSIRGINKSIATLALTVGLNSSDAEKRLDALEKWRVFVVEPKIEVLDASEPIVDMVLPLSARLRLVEEKLKMTYP